jgi:hypothetical protein
MAETTTVRGPRRAPTMDTTRARASTSATDVPPNLSTTMIASPVKTKNPPVELVRRVRVVRKL